MGRPKTSEFGQLRGWGVHKANANVLTSTNCHHFGPKRVFTPPTINGTSLNHDILNEFGPFRTIRGTGIERNPELPKGRRTRDTTVEKRGPQCPKTQVFGSITLLHAQKDFLVWGRGSLGGLRMCFYGSDARCCSNFGSVVLLNAVG